MNMYRKPMFNQVENVKGYGKAPLKLSMEKFKNYMKSGRGSDGVSKLEVLNKYKDYLQGKGADTVGYGKKRKRMSAGACLKCIHQNGGGWSDFTNWVKGAANTVYEKAIKPIGQYIADKPFTAIGKAASYLGAIPTPFSAGLNALGTTASSIGSTIGKGQSGGAYSQINDSRVRVRFQ